MRKLDKSLGFVLTRSARSMQRQLDLKLVSFNVTATQYVVLARLWEEDGIALSTLGERLDFDNPTITGLVSRMEKQGLVKRKKVSRDRRFVHIYLSPKGHHLKRKLNSVADGINRKAQTKLSTRDQTRLLETLNQIWKAMEESEIEAKLLGK
jgi:DNA-binding MarR family transcriptional regulator